MTSKTDDGGFNYGDALAAVIRQFDRDGGSEHFSVYLVTVYMMVVM